MMQALMEHPPNRGRHARTSRCVAVTGAAGGVGSRVIEAVTRLDPSRTVTALARDPSRVAASGVAVRPAYADYEDVDSLTAALDGASSLIFVSSDGDAATMRRHHRNVLAALTASSVKHVVYMSIIDVAADSPFYYAAIHRETEAWLEGIGIRCCVARTSVFADFFFTTFLEPALETGVVDVPMRHGSISLVSRDDVAAGLAAASLGGMTGELAFTGPAALRRHEIEADLRSACDRPVSLSAIDDERYRLKVATSGMKPWLVDAFSSMFRSIEQGRFSDVSGDLERLLGHPAATFASWISRLNRFDPLAGRSA